MAGYAKDHTHRRTSGPRCGEGKKEESHEIFWGQSLAGSKCQELRQEHVCTFEAECGRSRVGKGHKGGIWDMGN